ncbi:MAG: DNA polymerase III subunit delta [Nitrospirae bacterium]|nr:DNA polymerase III subunit delta [Nitrospirota bacterium]
MAGISYTEFSGRFKGIKPSPVYLFTGGEQLFIDEGVQLVSDRLLDKGIREFNYDILSASDVKAANVIGIAETLPVMTSYRVVVLKNVDEWTSKERESLISYINNPSPTTCLILTAVKLDKREKFASSIGRNGVMVLCQPLIKNQLGGWIRQEVKRSGIAINDDAAYMLSEMAGSDMMSLRNDIEKLTLYSRDKKTISLSDVTKVSNNIRSVSVFEVINAIFDRRLNDAILALKRAMDEGEAPVKIFFFITKEVRTMLKANVLIDAGEKPDKAAIHAGVPPFKAGEFSQRLKKFTGKELNKIFESLIETDSLLKGSAIKPAIVLEKLLLTVCGFVNAGGKP